MFWYGKMVGFFIGILLANPFVTVIGIIIGHQFDRKYSKQQRPFWSNFVAAQQVFFKTTFQIMGHLAKADGHVSHSEIAVAERIMQRLNLTPSMRKQAIEYFQQGKHPEFDVTHAMQSFKEQCRYRALWQMFLEIQWQATQAEGHTSHQKQALFAQICQTLGYQPSQFQHSYQYQYNYNQQQYHAPPQQDSLQSAYELLQVDPNADMKEVKKAYRKLMSQHHPDKLIAKGLPEEMIKLATEKTQAIQAAYDRICKASTV